LPERLVQASPRHLRLTTPEQLIALQRLAGNRAVASLVRQASPRPAPDVTVQRGIKKPGGLGELYRQAPSVLSYGRVKIRKDRHGKPLPILGRKLSASVKEKLQEIIDGDLKNKSGKDFTLRQAVAWAKREVAKSGKFLSGRAGKRLTSAQSCQDYLAGSGVDMEVVGKKLTDHAPLWDSVFSTVEFVEEDFQKIKGSGQSAYCSFTKSVCAAMPRLAPQISGFNEVAAAMVKAEAGAACALKGSMFERWSLSNVLAAAGTRIRFPKRGAMTQERVSDGFDKSTGTLWDMKHYLKKMAESTNNNQAGDYDEILDKGYKSTEGVTIKAVNYLFPSKDAAEANAWLITTYGFGVYYVEDPATLKQYVAGD
jgi:hypothetical protein